jgi:hypothetical protein
MTPHAQTYDAFPAFDPWAIVNLVMRELAAENVKTRFGSETDLGEAARAAGELLAAFGVASVVPDDDEGEASPAR